MTSTYDSIRATSCQLDKLSDEEKKEFESLVDECVTQASKRTPKDWSYTKWLEIPHNKQWNGHELLAKTEFLADTHYHLDHTARWHFRVFTKALELKLWKFFRRMQDKGLVMYVG